MRTRVYLLFAVCVGMLCSCGSARDVSGSENEQVNVGYGTVSRDNLTYSVSQVSPDNDIDVYSNMYDYLRGRIAGLDVGTDNNMNSVHIRGINSINSSTVPLVLVDGVEVNDLDAVNPHDVASVSVLKDSSASIYGVRGANGVILITTKMAKQAKDDAAAAKKKAREEKRAARSAKKK